MKYQLEVTKQNNGFAFSMKYAKGNAISGFDTSIDSIMRSLTLQVRASLERAELESEIASEETRARESYIKTKGTK